MLSGILNVLREMNNIAEKLTKVKPKIIKDIIIVEGKGSDGKYYILKNPREERFFKICEDEKNVIDLINGEKTIEEIVEIAKTKWDIEQDEVHEFINNLKEKHLLESEEAYSGKGRRVQGNIFAFRIKILNPQKLLKWIDEFLGFWGIALIIIICVSIMVFSAYLIIMRPEFLKIEPDYLKSALNLLIFYAAASIMVTFHELAHAFTCYKLGGNVSEMGFMLLYFIPCFYTDISNTYLFKKKRHRIAVILAGPFMDIIATGAGIIAMAFSQKGSFLNVTGYLVMLTGAGKTLFFNFNPFIKMDGYYLLEEILGSHNLMERSMELLKNFFLKSSETSVFFRKEAKFILYAFFSILYVMVMGVLMILTLWRFLNLPDSIYFYISSGLSAILFLILHLKSAFKK